VDDRHVKQTPVPFALFVKDRFASGDFKNISPPEGMKLISQEWKSLSAAEKQVRSN
jgi:hypothetical protein